MSLQPGDGYTFSASSSGFTLDIQKPWIPPAGDGGLVLGFAIPKAPDVPLPPDPPAVVTPGTVEEPQQFQCNVLAMPVSGTPAPVLQVAMGSVTYTHSLMPLIKRAPFTDHRQAYINFAAVLSSGVTPVPVGDSSSPWMLGGGGYALTEVVFIRSCVGVPILLAMVHREVGWKTIFSARLGALVLRAIAVRLPSAIVVASTFLVRSACPAPAALTAARICLATISSVACQRYCPRRTLDGNRNCQRNSRFALGYFCANRPGNST